MDTNPFEVIAGIFGCENIHALRDYVNGALEEWSSDEYLMVFPTDQDPGEMRYYPFPLPDGDYEVTLPNPALDNSGDWEAGMVRFIHHRPTLEPTVICNWVAVLLRMIHLAVGMTEEEIIEIDDESASEFARQIGMVVHED